MWGRDVSGKRRLSEDEMRIVSEIGSKVARDEYGVSGAGIEVDAETNEDGDATYRIVIFKTIPRKGGRH